MHRFGGGRATEAEADSPQRLKVMRVSRQELSAHYAADVAGASFRVTLARCDEQASS